MRGGKSGYPLERTRDLGGKVLSVDKMPYSGKRELLESTSSRKTGALTGGTLQSLYCCYLFRDLGSERLLGLKGGTLEDMHDSRERELTEPTSSRKKEHQVSDWVAIPQSQLSPIIVPVGKNL